MLFKKNDEVIIKSLDELKKAGLLEAIDRNGVTIYKNNDTNYLLYDNFPFFGTEAKVLGIDNKDNSIPYWLSCGIWAPEWMLKYAVEPEKEEPIVKDAPIEPKVFINKFNGKPFGKLFLKLIAIDPKIAEFSSTIFSRLRKHELQYIARLLISKGCPDIDTNSHVEELVSYCYNQTKLL